MNWQLRAAYSFRKDEAATCHHMTSTTVRNGKEKAMLKCEEVQKRVRPWNPKCLLCSEVCDLLSGHLYARGKAYRERERERPCTRFKSPIIGKFPNFGLDQYKQSVPNHNTGSLGILYRITKGIVTIPGATFRFLRIGQRAEARRHSYSTALSLGDERPALLLS